MYVNYPPCFFTPTTLSDSLLLILPVAPPLVLVKLTVVEPFEISKRL
ncbi:unnamed protein product [Schistosoma margrebowiei]|uniref:Uncharacterized protein n=1 Tax=Schistosoma margrebowiei TaxID=48269 RepID=A0A183MBP2_9TREM|nr:unnamed protein product [Schistosoma margrebowiei]